PVRNTAGRHIHVSQSMGGWALEPSVSVVGRAGGEALLGPMAGCPEGAIPGRTDSRARWARLARSPDRLRLAEYQPFRPGSRRTLGGPHPFALRGRGVGGD